MDTFEAIIKRRSIRKFTGEPIPLEHLEKIVDAGRWAPTGHNRQPWEFIVVTNQGMIDQLSIVAEWMKKSAAIIAVVLDTTATYWIEDGSAAIENILLACTALGYGACWLEGTTIPMEDRFKPLLNVPEDKRLFTLIPIGVPNEWPMPKNKKSLEEVIHWDKYGQ